MDMLKWVFSDTFGQRPHPGVVRTDGSLLVGYGYYLSALNPDMSLKWRFTFPEKCSAQVTCNDDGTIYASAGVNGLYALNIDSVRPAKRPWPMFKHDKFHTGRFDRSFPVIIPVNENILVAVFLLSLIIFLYFPWRLK